MNKTSIDLVGLELTKSNIEKIASDLTKQVDEGFQDAIELDCKLKFVESTVKVAREKLNSKAIFQAHNRHEINTVKTTVKIGYAQLNYEEDDAYKKLKERLEERKEHLNLAFKSKDEIVVNGEIIPKVSIKSYVKDSITYIFPK